MPPQPMNAHDQDALAELIAIKVCERYVVIMEKYVQQEVKLHKAECSAAKFSKITGVVCAVIGGGCVAVINWMLRK